MKQTVNTKHPKTGKNAKAYVVADIGMFYRITFSDGTVATVLKSDCKKI